jgi:hypothetical protein
MAYVALRGVCIGVDRHLVPGDPVPDVGDDTAQFLLSIGAIGKGPEPPAEAVAPPIPEPTEPAKASKKEKQS